VAPGERSLDEGLTEGGQVLQLLHHARELLQLAAREAEALPRVVVEAEEAEAVMRAPAKEGPGEAAEHPAAERFPAREAAEEWIEQLGAEAPVELALLA